jgi:hypothetical protein
MCDKFHNGIIYDRLEEVFSVFKNITGLTQPLNKSRVYSALESIRHSGKVAYEYYSIPDIGTATPFAYRIKLHSYTAFRWTM